MSEGMGALITMEMCLIAGSCEVDLNWLKAVSKNYDYIIAADKGYKALKEANVKIDIAIGDFDSLGYVPDDVKVIKLKSEKDDTDTMSAVRYAIDNGAKIITLIGGIGGRLDHTIANLQTLGFIVSNGVFGKLIHEDNEIIGLLPGEYKLKKRNGYSMSLFSMSDEVTGLCEKGVKYPLDNAVLTNTFPLGVSNEITDDCAVFSFESGILFVCFSRL